MKVLHVTPSMSPHWGGPVPVVSDLTAALAQRGVDCEIATTRGHRVGAETVSTPGIPIHSFPTGLPGRWWPGYSRPLSRFLEAETARFDLVHVHEIWHYGAATAFRAARRRDIPYVLATHGELDGWAMRRKFLKKRLYLKMRLGRILQTADALHALVAAEAARFDELGLQPPVFTAPNGISADLLDALRRPDTAVFRARYPELAGKRILLFLGRMEIKKGLDVLARSFARIAREFSDTALLVVGPEHDGSGRRMAEILQAEGVRERAIFTGMLTGDDRLAAFGCADLFVLSSYSEGFTVATLEALAAGLPVVISEACNFPEVAEREAGFVVAPEDAPFAEAIRALLSDSSLRSRMGRNARRLIEQDYTWPAIAATIAAQYRMLVKSGK